jgi:hypothetical protein
MIVPVRPASRATAMGGGVPAAQPGGGDHRRGDRGADGRGQRVRAPDQDRLPLDLRVPEPRALLGVPVDPLLHRVDVDERQHFPAGQQRRLPRQARQEPPARLLQLGDVPPGVRAQMRAERGRRPDPAEQRAHRAVPQHVHVIDAVRARGHARDQGRHLQVRVDAALLAGTDVLRDQARQPGAPGERHHRDQPGVRHEIRVIELSADPRQRMQQLHLQGVLSNRELEASTTPILPAQRAPFTLTRPKAPLFERWIEAKGFEPLTFYMPCTSVSSKAIALSPVLAGQGSTRV